MRDLPTPALVLDHTKLQANIDRMRSRSRLLDVRLRPHMKTAKSIDVARLVLDSGEGITVSTLAEAEYFARHGIVDIMYAVGFEPGKARRVQALREDGVEIQVVVDSVEMASWLVDADVASGVWMEIDSDGRRAGLQPDDARVDRVAAALGGLLRGVMTHAGGSYACEDPAGVADAAETERSAVVTTAERLREAGFPVTGVSVGSTPTATFAVSEHGVTEMRPGVFMFQDLYQAGLGVCEIEDIAVSVLTTVIGHRDPGELVIDAGALALSLDRSTSRQTVDWGFGAVCDLGGAVIPDLMVRAVTQEHGIVADRHDAVAATRFPIGTRLRILPNHACMTAAAHTHYHVIHPDLPTPWPRITGW